MAKKKGSILIIDDDPGVRQTLFDIFTYSGYSVQKASTGKSGLELVEKKLFDAVLIDIQLPDMTGVEVLCAIKQKDQEMVCWVITGDATRELAIEVLQAGANDFFTKPLHIEQVLHRMEEALGKLHLRRKLKNTQDQYRLVVETVRNAIITVDADGVVTFANPFAGIMFGYERDALLHIPMATLLHESFHSSFAKFLQRVFFSIHLASVEEMYSCIGVRYDGQEIFLEISSGIVGAEQNFQVTLIIQDITEREKVEQELSRKNEEIETSRQELEKALVELQGTYRDLKNTQHQMLQQEKMASVGQLVAGVAHEINNPMGFISSNLTTLRKYFDRLRGFGEIQAGLIESEEALDQAKKARRKMKIDYILDDLPDLFEESLEGVDRVKTIVRNLKSFSRMDAAEMTMADINECLESTLNIIWNELKYTTSVHRQFGELPRIMCYPQELSQVFMNLLVNAGYAIGSQGTIRIKTWEADGNIFVSIADSGCGIPQDKIERIFEPFFTTKEVGKGTGLGLSISYDIVKKHDGELVVESEEGKGATFTVKLPVNIKEQ